MKFLRQTNGYRPLQLANTFALSAVPMLDEAQLSAALREAKSLWPHISHEASDFLSFLTAHHQRDELSKAKHLADLYLCSACMSHDAAALEVFDGLLKSSVRFAVMRIESNPARADDILQQVREKLLIDQPGRRAKLRNFKGLGSLKAWLKAAAIRVALNARHHEPVNVDADVNLAVMAITQSIETRLMNHTLLPTVSRALKGAFEDLSPEERNLMRLHLIDGLGIDQLARIFGGHRSTIARRLVKMKGSILDKVKEKTSQNLAMPMAELEEMLGVVQGQLDVSLERWLRVTAS